MIVSVSLTEFGDYLLYRNRKLEYHGASFVLKFLVFPFGYNSGGYLLVSLYKKCPVALDASHQILLQVLTYWLKFAL